MLFCRGEHCFCKPIIGWCRLTARLQSRDDTSGDHLGTALSQQMPQSCCTPDITKTRPATLPGSGTHVYSLCCPCLHVYFALACMCTYHGPTAFLPVKLLVTSCWTTTWGEPGFTTLRRLGLLLMMVRGRDDATTRGVPSCRGWQMQGVGQIALLSRTLIMTMQSQQSQVLAYNS